MNPKPCRPLLVLSILAFFLSSCAKKETQLRAYIDTSLGMIVVRLYPETTPKTVANFQGLADGSRLLADGADPSTAKPFYDGLIFHRVISDFMIQGGCPNGNGMGGPGYTFEDETYVEEPITGPIKTEERATAVIRQLLQPHLQKNKGKSPIPEIDDLLNTVNKARSLDALLALNVEDVAQWIGHEGPVNDRRLLGHVDYGTLCMANRGPNTNGSQFFIVTNKDGVRQLDGKHTVFGEVVQGMDVAEAIQNVPTEGPDRPVEPVVINSIRVKQVKVTLPKAES